MINRYDDLTIKQFLQVKLISELESDPMIRKMKMLAELTNRSLDEVESLPIGELVKQLQHITDIESLPVDGKVNMKFKLGGKRWIIKWRQQDLSGEQYIDVTHFCKDSTKIVHNIHSILASLAVERTWFSEKPYDGIGHKERAELFLNEMKIKDAYPIMVFFCKYSQTLADNTQIYLEVKAKEVLTQVKKHFTQNGVGLPLSTT